MFESFYSSPRTPVILGAVLRSPGLILVESWMTLGATSWIPRGTKNREILRAMICLILMMGGLLLSTLPFEPLVTVYCHLLALGIVAILRELTQLHAENLTSELASEVPYSEVLYLLGSMVIGRLLIRKFLDKPSWMRSNLPFFALSLPLGAVWLLKTDEGLIEASMEVADFIMVLWALGLAVSAVPKMYNFFYGRYLELVFDAHLNQRSLFPTFMAHLPNLVDPFALAVFWAFCFFDAGWNEWLQLSSPSRDYVIKDVDSNPFVFLVVCVAQVCRSPLSLVASCLASSFACHCVIKAASLYLAGAGVQAPGVVPDALKAGLAEGCIMFVLGLQTDLIDLPMPGRVGAVTIILYITLASLLQTLLDVTHPVLIAISAASRNPAKHFRVLALCFLLFVASSAQSYFLLNAMGTDSMGLWAVVVVSTSMLTAIQVVGHVIHYCLFLYDSLQPAPSESLDDSIFYLKAAVHSLEVISSLMIIFAGLRDFWDGDDWSHLNVLMLSAHSYFNVYLRIRGGWAKFLLRQRAAHRIDGMEDASYPQIRAENPDGEVCAICYYELAPEDEPELDLIVKRTNCGHLFHRGCLRKWLFMQNSCPMCHQVVFKEEEDEKGEETEEEEILNGEGENEEEEEGELAESEDQFSDEEEILNGDLEEEEEEEWSSLQNQAS